MTVAIAGPRTAASAANGEGPSGSGPIAEAKRLMAIEQRLLHTIQWVVFGGVILLTVGAGALSWEHLTHIAATNGHIAPPHLLFLFPTIVDGFMVMSSGVVVRHDLTDELGWRTWYAGYLVAATASLSVCLNIQDSTGHAIVPGWVLPGIAPTLYMLGTELGLGRAAPLDAQAEEPHPRLRPTCGASGAVQERGGAVRARPDRRARANRA